MLHLTFVTNFAYAQFFALLVFFVFNQDVFLSKAIRVHCVTGRVADRGHISVSSFGHPNGVIINTRDGDLNIML